MRRLHILLVLWCLLVPTPGVLTLLGFLAYYGDRSHVGGTLAGFWIGGYLAQFALFMWISRIAGARQRILWWFAASLLPWGFDWILPVHPLYGSLLFVVLFGTAFWISWDTRRLAALKENGVRATGVVLEVFKPWMNVIINRLYIKRKVRLRIERSDGTPPYEAVLNGLFMIGDIPSPGARLPLIVDSKDPKHFVSDDTADASYGAPPPSKPARAQGDPEFMEELERLSMMHQRGELTDAEFTSAKKKLLRD